MTRLQWLRRAFALLGFTFACLAAPSPVVAHPGHDDPEPVVSGSGLPRAAASSETFELVAVAAGPELRLYLDHYATNAPIAAAVVEVAENGGNPIAAVADPDGVFVLRAPWLTVAGRHELTVTIAAGDLSDLLTTTLNLPTLAPGFTPAPPRDGLQSLFAAQRGLMTAGLAFVLGAVLTWAMLARGRARLIFGMLVLIVGLLIAGVAFAQDAAPDAPRRQPDGSVAMPKDAQRLLAVRTMVAEEGSAARAVQVIGQVIPDPNAAGRVQSSQPGRIEPGEDGLAHVGKRVRAGDILAVIAPAIATVERGTVGAQLAEIDQQIRLAEQRASRLAGLAGSVAGKEIDEARAELAGARARRAAIGQTLGGRELLRAPVSGVVTAANVVNGQFVEGKDILFEILDPARLWVEAIGFNSVGSGDLRAAAALTTEGTPLDLVPVGRGQVLRQGAIPLLFRIAAPPVGLPVGSPVTVIIRLETHDIGITLPRAAVIRLPNGGAAVWDHVAPERFVARPVRLQPLDGTRVLILAGLKPGQRIVTQGADLLNQVR